MGLSPVDSVTPLDSIWTLSGLWCPTKIWLVVQWSPYGVHMEYQGDSQDLFLVIKKRIFILFLGVKCVGGKVHVRVIARHTMQSCLLKPNKQFNFNDFPSWMFWILGRREMGKLIWMVLKLCLLQVSSLDHGIRCTPVNMSCAFLVISDMMNHSLILTATYVKFSHVLAGYFEACHPYMYVQADFTVPFWFQHSWKMTRFPAGYH